MILDFRAASSPAEFDADLCVVGAGAAGIAMAQSLAGTNLSVCVIESGGLEPDPATQALYHGEAVGLPWTTALASSRLRQFGGTTGEWGGGCMPLDASDMATRPWVPHSGWPITRAQLEPFYDRARAILAVPAYGFGDHRLVAGMRHKPVAFDPDLLTNVYAMLSAKPRLGEVFHRTLSRSANVTVLLNANLIEFDVDDTARHVRQARLRSLHGRIGRVRAKHFVLACGGIENARLLLLSNSVSRPGLGNDRGNVGRFFMDHPSGRLGSIVSQHPEALIAAYDRHRARRTLPIYPEIALSEKLQRQQRTLNGRVRPAGFEENVADGITAFRNLRFQMATGGPGRLPSQLRRILADIDQVAPSIWRVLRGRPAVAARRIELHGFFEQAPNPDSRITLGRDLDALGQRRVQLDWQLTDLDRHTFETAATTFSAELTRLGLGRVQLDPWLCPGGNAFEGVGGAAHHIGTTRMSDDPATGVVDADCRVHGMENLHVAGSSVFPTGGWAFPTFTIVALALRLADRLAGYAAKSASARAASPEFSR